MRLSSIVFSGTFSAIFGAILMSCATESHQAVKVEQSASANTASSYQGERHPVVVGKFDNRSGFMRGVFSDGPDRLSSQAKTVLIAHLQRTGRFSVLDRDNMEENSGEAKLSGKKQKIKGADFTITGDVAEFGRKEIGDRQLFGIVGSGKKQAAYSKITLNVVDVATSEVVFSASGSGEYTLSNREVFGFGGTAAYDSTLNGKVLDLAMREAVDRLVEGLEQKKWTVTK
ncbi:MAG: CsgG/HfaB family protein [Bdellovibrionales bacterium]|nr:CsgG/HfaB family protein [Bdellovibrionales bacterium]